ncbi:MAG: hypothetical protein C0403_05235, partial [Desulfobacterium sp.]|nr:hypothetical protein [Desulfobacterium sp.]
MIKKMRIFLILFWAYASISSPDNGNASESVDEKETGVTISAVVIEKGTRISLQNIKVYLRDLKTDEIVASPVTGSKGDFLVTVKPGKYHAIITASGYDKFEEEIDVKLEQENQYIFRVIPQILNPYRVVIRQKKKKSEISKQTISLQEAASLPGSNRDVLKSVTNLPGVNSVSVFNGYGNGIVIRGSAQEDSLFKVNEHSIPGFYHFGGFESIIEPEMVDSI